MDEKNSYETIDIKVENITNPWFPKARRVQKVLSRSLKEREQDAIYHNNFDHPKYLNFFSDGNVNKMGVNRGYRVHIRDMMKQMYPKNWPIVRGAEWSKNQMTVTKYKEDEETSLSVYLQYSMYNPVVDFANTATAANSASFYLRPYNYFDEDPSMASHDALLILPTENGANVKRFGTPQGPACAVKNESVDFKGIYGDI